MSRASKITLAATSLGAIGIVIFVHYAQRAEKAAMHAGVIRDYEQQRLKRERQADFEMQQALEKEYRKVQTVSDRGGLAGQDSGTGR
ncbi:cytochrome c oxidase assembly protein [Zopfia rhizophila CBS 207.26]|uniref:Cytochrome c oxidase assembly protein n=1 Tax=Zopfia rhizophila CBS 207.26 TaxID=1314779 RepID=A0A6A6EEK4_9PEZI|nr:cytochrome c oxidase assembly protein [Zopfia rhizophila CBS 207.26]